jgi:predicted TIM-barrel fold metal-dependent hydrolase
MHVLDAAAKHFRSDVPRPNAEEIAAYHGDRKMAAVIFCVDSEANTGEVPVPNDEVLEIAAANDDVLIPFVSVDPPRGKRGVSEVKRLIAKGAPDPRRRRRGRLPAGMPIILAHPSLPWQEEAISVAMHKAQVHLDLSGWSRPRRSYAASGMFGSTSCARSDRDSCHPR